MADSKAPAPKQPSKPWKEMSRGEKIQSVVLWVGGAVIILLLLWGFMGVLNPTHNSKQAEKIASQAQQPAKQQTSTKPLTPEQQLKQAATNAIGKDKIRNVDVEPQVDGGYGVFVEYNADDNLSTGMIKKGIEKAMSDVYIALYHDSGQDVRQASVAAYMPLEDQYGNTSDGVVYKSVLRKDVASQINYSQEKAVLELNIIPKLWTTTLLNASFR